MKQQQKQPNAGPPPNSVPGHKVTENVFKYPRGYKTFFLELEKVLNKKRIPYSVTVDFKNNMVVFRKSNSEGDRNMFLDKMVFYAKKKKQIFLDAKGNTGKFYL